MFDAQLRRISRTTVVPSKESDLLFLWYSDNQKYEVLVRRRGMSHKKASATEIHQPALSMFMGCYFREGKKFVRNFSKNVENERRVL